MVRILKALLFLATAATAAPSSSNLKRESTIAQVLQDVTNIDTNVKVLIDLVRKYQGGIIAAAPQLVSVTGVKAALAGGVYNSGELPDEISEADANALIAHVNATLAIDNPIALELIISKKKLYQDSALDIVLLPSLKELLKGHEAFSLNVASRVPESTLLRGLEVINVITRSLRKAVKTFQK